MCLINIRAGAPEESEEGGVRAKELLEEVEEEGEGPVMEKEGVEVDMGEERERGIEGECLREVGALI